MPSTRGVKPAKMEKVGSDKRNASLDSRSRKDDLAVVTASTPCGDKGTSFWTEEPEPCPDCGKKVLASQLGLKCDGCGLWHHIECERVNDDVYDFLAKHEDIPSILGLCKKCSVTSKKMLSMLISVQDYQQQLEGKINALGSMMEKRMDDLSEMVFSKLDIRHSQDSDNAEMSQKRVEEKVDELVIAVNKQAKTNDHLVHDCVEQAVRLKLDR